MSLHINLVEKFDGPYNEPEAHPYGLARVVYEEEEYELDFHGLNGCIVYIDNDPELSEDGAFWEIPCITGPTFDFVCWIEPRHLVPLTAEEENTFYPLWEADWAAHTAKYHAGCCELCDWTPPRTGSGMHGLAVHHVRPRKMGGGEHPLNKIRLCANCHSLVHGAILKRQKRENGPGFTFSGPMTRPELRAAYTRLVRG